MIGVSNIKRRCSKLLGGFFGQNATAIEVAIPQAFCRVMGLSLACIGISGIRGDTVLMGSVTALGLWTVKLGSFFSDKYLGAKKSPSKPRFKKSLSCNINLKPTPPETAI